MDTEQKGQETVEQEAVPEENEPVSEDTETEKPEGEKEEPITFKTKADLETHIGERVKSESNRIANQSTAPLQSDNDKLKTEVAGLKRAAVYKSEDTKLSRLEKKEKEEYGSTETTESVRTFQEARTEVIDLGRVNQTKSTELAEKESTLLKGGLRQDAFEKALGLFLPEDTEFLSEINAFAEKLMKAETQKEMDLIFSMEEAKIKAKAEAPKPKRPAPDKTVTSVSGGEDKSKLTPRERIELGLKKWK